MKDIHRTVLVLLSVVLMPLSVCADPLTEGIHSRERLMERYRGEIATASLRELEADRIGEWYDIIETSVFMLIRRTELFRGTVRFIITDRKCATCMLYPDGTFLVSTGLLDYIDALLFMDSAGSARRIRNLNGEREHMFASIAAVCAARFALNYYDTDKKSNLSMQQLYTVDVMASVLLTLAGYPDGLSEKWLELLTSIQSDGEKAKQFSSFLGTSVTPAGRRDELIGSKDDVDHLYEAVSGVIFALQHRRGMADALNVLGSLLKLFPRSLYFNRLNALVSHQLWLAAIDRRDMELATILPAAVYDTASVFSFFQSADFIVEDEDDEVVDYFSKTVPVKETNVMYSQAKKAYGDYLSLIYEAGVASSYALLLASSPLVHERSAVLSIAEQADLAHAGFGDKTARANYASLLYLVGKDYTKAQALLADCLYSPPKKKALFLTTGFPSDERLIRCNYLRVLKRIQDKQGAAEQQTVLETLLKKPEVITPIAVRGISVGSTVDDLLRAWHRPSRIIYNYYSERWAYRSLNAELNMSSKSGDGVVLQMSIGFPSALTLFGDIRTGESRKVLEAKIGRPRYYSCDTLVYYWKGNVVQVLYGNNKIRNLIIRNIYEKR